MKELWTKANIPHKGWECVDVEDLGEATHTCEMCGKEEIRYVHFVEHPEHPTLKVGCVCADKMAVGYNGKLAERKLKNSIKRKENFRRADKWKISEKGNRHRTKNGYRVVIGMGFNNRFWVSGDVHTKKTYETWNSACDAVGEYLESQKENENDENDSLLKISRIIVSGDEIYGVCCFDWRDSVESVYEVARRIGDPSAINDYT